MFISLYLLQIKIYGSIIIVTPLIHDIQERGKIIVHRIITVNTVIDCNEPDILLREYHFSVEADLKIVSSKSAHVLNNYRINFACFNIGNHLLKSRSVEVGSGETIVCVML